MVNSIELKNNFSFFYSLIKLNKMETKNKLSGKKVVKTDLNLITNENY